MEDHLALLSESGYVDVQGTAVIVAQAQGPARVLHVVVVELHIREPWRIIRCEFEVACVGAEIQVEIEVQVQIKVGRGCKRRC